MPSAARSGLCLGHFVCGRALPAPECAPGPLPFAAGLADGAFAAGRHFLLVGVFVHCTGRRVDSRRRRGVPVQIRLGRTAGEIRVGVYL